MLFYKLAMYTFLANHMYLEAIHTDVAGASTYSDWEARAQVL